MAPSVGSPAGAPDAATRGLLIHAAGPLEPDALAGILRSAANARAALGVAAAIEVVVQGPGVRLLAAGSALDEALGDARQLGVHLLACGNSLRSAGLEDNDLAPGIGTVPAAIAHLARRQWEGWAYARL
ncbi:DsrE family protein [Pseudarthrobacter sulfonivorans]|uniref:DsrE family protein n=1 Tax=Pseudarthrobacter sulfonivorans TaxID=121292 RepID=UPI00210603D8|nr:DsrE family protein [Pseudarthrobacter sulfonivorans]